MYINTQLKPPLQYWTISKHLYLCNTDQHLYTSVHCRLNNLYTIYKIPTLLQLSTTEPLLYISTLLKHFVHLYTLMNHLKKNFILLNPICTTLYSNEPCFHIVSLLNLPFIALWKKSLCTSLHYWTPLYRSVDYF